MGRLLDELITAEKELGVLHEASCTAAENRTYSERVEDGEALPEGVFYDTEAWPEERRFFTLARDADMTDKNLKNLLRYRQLSYLKTIKNCAVFFTVLTAIAIAAAAVYAISAQYK